MRTRAHTQELVRGGFSEVVMGCRDVEAGERARAEISRELGAPQSKVGSGDAIGHTETHTHTHIPHPLTNTHAQTHTHTHTHTRSLAVPDGSGAPEPELPAGRR